MTHVHTHVQQQSPTLVAPRRVHRGMPGYINAAIRRARRGGSAGYEEVGHQLGSHVENEVPREIEDDDWAVVVRSIEPSVLQGDRATLKSWLSQTFPVILKAVPARRRDAFVDGFIAGWKDEADRW